MIFNLSNTILGGGTSVTPVTFGELDGVAVFEAGDGGISYIDGAGTFQTATSLASGSETVVDMQSGSLLVYVNILDPASGYIYCNITGMTLVQSRTYRNARANFYTRIYRVD